MNTFKISEQEKEFYINLISERFLSNSRMLFLFDKKNEKKYYYRVRRLVEYCFLLALKLGGLYIAKNKKTIVLFYEKKKFKRNNIDYLRYIRILLSIKIKKILMVLKNEKKINKTKLKIDDYIYVWFIAQEKNYGKIDGLIEINEMLFKHSKKKNLPILLETSNITVLNLYKRAGFVIYNRLKLEENIIYFLADRSTVELNL